MNFTVYKSSAGSGKTFTLVKEYLRIALSDTSDPPQRYKKILAITFTNKAAAEMKERIISALKELSNPKAGITSPLAKILVEELALDNFTLAARSKELLRTILHNYTDFAIGTIDSFTHRIVRAFSHDLKLPVNFEVETDDAKLIREAVDVLINRIGEDPKLTDVLVQFSESKADEEKNWQIEDELRKIGRHLLKEEGAQQAEKLKELSLDDFMHIRDVLKSSTSTFKEKVISISKKAIAEIDKAGLTVKDFASTDNGLAGRFYRFAKGELKLFGEPTATIKKIVSGDKWHSGKADKSAQAAIANLKPQLENSWNQLEKLREEEYPMYVFRNILQKNIYSIAVLNEIGKILLDFREKQNILHISEFNRIISRVVFEEPVPFIYERLGEKYSNYLLDEFQDTSVVQWQNLLPLIENSLAGNNFNMLVGDGKQAIYRWRGGEVEQFANLPLVKDNSDNPLIKEREQSLIRNYGEKHLAKNYRSKMEIIEFNNGFFRNLCQYLGNDSGKIYDQLEQEFDPKNTGGYIRVEELETIAEEKNEIYIAKTISLIRQLKEEKRPYSEIAILTRTNKEGSLIASALLEEKVPVLSSESLLLNKSPLVAFMVSLLRCIDNPADELAGAQVLEFLVSTNKLQSPLHERLKEFDETENNLQKVLSLNKIEIDLIRFSRLPLYQRCEEIIQCFDLGEKSDSYLVFFLDEILNYTNSRNKDKMDFFSYWEDRKEKASVVVPIGMNAVTVMTIHKSKGLEFPVVILPFANWDIENKIKDDKWISFEDPEIPGFTSALIPVRKELLETPYKSFYEIEKDKVLLDAINNLYVAMTRAEQRLYIFTAQVKKIKDEPKNISDFFTSALDAMGISFADHVSEKGTPGPAELSNEIQSVCEQPINIQSHSWENRIRIRSNSSDHWESNDATGSRDKGNLLHEILSDIETIADIDSAIQKAIQEGLTNSKDGDSIKELLLKLLKLPELSSCFSGNGKVRKESELLLPDGKRLRPDRVIENSQETIILDYKTGNPDPKYKKQLDQYAEVLKGMGYEKIQRKIVYTETLKVESW